MGHFKKIVIKIKREDLPKPRMGIQKPKIQKVKVKYNRNVKHKKKSG